MKLTYAEESANNRNKWWDELDNEMCPLQVKNIVKPTDKVISLALKYKKYKFENIMYFVSQKICGQAARI